MLKNKKYQLGGRTQQLLSEYKPWDLEPLGKKDMTLAFQITDRLQGIYDERLKKKDEYVAEVLSVLSLCCNTILKVSKTDLAYILNDDNSNISIINSRFYTTHLVDKRPKYPKYKQKNLLHDETVGAIEYIEERQLIMIVNDEISFTHPNYYEAARDLLFPISQSKQEKILKYLNNCNDAKVVKSSKLINL